MSNSEKEVIDDLVLRLEKKGYKDIYGNQNYSRYIVGDHLLEGEFDVIARSKYGTWNYYEIKKTWHPKQIKKAISQFKRAKRAFPQEDMRFILIDHYSHAKRYGI